MTALLSVELPFCPASSRQHVQAFQAGVEKNSADQLRLALLSATRAVLIEHTDQIFSLIETDEQLEMKCATGCLWAGFQ